MHDHPTFTKMITRCECCDLLSEFFFKTKHDRVICKGCLPHNGSPEKQQRKARDHLGLYRSELAIAHDDLAEAAAKHRELIHNLKAQHADEVAEQAASIARLRSAHHDRASDPSLDRWMADEAVSQAREHRDRAYRQRDEALTAIWQIDQLHHLDDQSPDRCSCGRAGQGCHELLAIASQLDNLRRWENVQIDRLLDGLAHGLPDNHPEVLRMVGRKFGQGRQA